MYHAPLTGPADHLDTDHLDQADIEAIRAGGSHSGRADSPPWSALLTRYQDRLFGVCLRMIGTGPAARQTASDLCQDAMVKLIHGLDSYDGSAKFSTWAIRVTMNVCLSHLRSQKLRKHASLDGPAIAGSSENVRSFDPPSREPNSDLRVQQNEVGHQMASALGRLEPDQRSILVLRDVRGLDYAQIAQVLGVAEGTVKSRLFRARLALRQILENHHPSITQQYSRPDADDAEP